MSSSTLPSAALPVTAPSGVAGRPPVRQRPTLPAWLEIAKPRLIPLLLATTLGGMALSPTWPLGPLPLLCTLVGGSLASAAAGVLNCLWEQELDGRMQRTSRRALPAGRIPEGRALALAVTMAVASVLLLVLGVNPLAAALALLGLCSYVLLYTALLKPRTPHNIVIGGVAGAIPPLVGAAAAGSLGWPSWWLFTLVMVWTPAHFWALALLLHDDYRSVGIPMLPVVRGLPHTAQAIERYSWITVAISLLGVVALPTGGWLYALLLTPFNGRLLQLGHRLRRDPHDPVAARSMFRWSIFYLFGICLLLLLARSPAASLALPSLTAASPF
ncbi:MAG: heme o synthase [Cyanobacteriota bacterium]|nr:heme o synthase [Cyanobacteriota bacterium]